MQIKAALRWISNNKNMYFNKNLFLSIRTRIKYDRLRHHTTQNPSSRNKILLRVRFGFLMTHWGWMLVRMFHIVFLKKKEKKWKVTTKYSNAAVSVELLLWLTKILLLFKQIKIWMAWRQYFKDMQFKLHRIIPIKCYL